VIANLNLKLIINRRIPDSPLPTQGAHVPVSGLTGFVYILFSFFFYFFHKSPLFCFSQNCPESPLKRAKSFIPRGKKIEIR